jgi:capsular exopolysaccharide synthesis family protein
LNSTPVEPRPLFVMSLALALGLVVGVSLAVLRETLDNSIRSVEILKSASGAAVLGVIAYDETAKQSPLIVESHSRSMRAEAFRQLRTNLQFVDVDNPIKVLVVTSSVAEEGKSSTATNLAVSFAAAGQKVLLIEGDLRRPRVAEYLGLDASVGLTNVLAGQVAVDEVLQTWGRGGLTVLPSGSIPPNPSELLGSRNMSDLLVSLRKTFQVIIIDSPPLLPVTDAAIVAAKADGAILVVRYGLTKRQQVSAAVDALKAVDARVLGTLLNRTPTRGVDSYSYGYGYYQDNSPNRDRLDIAPLIEADARTTPAAQTAVV